MDISLYQLRTFQEVARTRSLTRTARNLGYTQPSVTAHIRKLESRSGVTLLERLPHGVALTEAGEVFRDYTERILATVDEMAGALDPGKGKVRGRVNVGASLLAMDFCMGWLLAQSRYRYPEIQLSPKSLSAGEVESAVLSRTVDIGLFLSKPDTLGFHPGLDFHRLRSVTFQAVHSPALVPDSPGRHPGRRHSNLLSVDPSCESQRASHSALQDPGEPQRTILEVGSVLSGIQFVLEGYGISVLPEEFVRTHVERGDLVPHEGWEPMTHDLVAVWPKREWRHPAARGLIDLVRLVEFAPPPEQRSGAETGLTPA